MTRCEQLSLRYLNFHPGAHLNKISEGECLKIIAESVNIAISKTKNVVAVIENTAGQGSNVGYRFEHLAGIIELIDDKSRVGRRLMAGAALARYEISNYARPGLQCRHNLNYWENGFYLGLGPGAVSAFGGGRFAIPPGLARYRECAVSGQFAWDVGERLDREAAFRETVIMGLRLIRGVSAAVL